jgi:hypothetical protein
MPFFRSTEQENSFRNSKESCDFAADLVRRWRCSEKKQSLRPRGILRMYIAVACVAKRDEVMLGIFACMASKLLVVDLQVRHRSA